LDHTQYKNSDLDIYVEHRYTKTIVAFLKDEGYTFQPSSHQRLCVQVAIEEIGHRMGHQDFGILEDGDKHIGGGLAGVLKHQMGYQEIQLIIARHSPLALKVYHGINSTRVSCSSISSILLTLLFSRSNSSKYSLWYSVRAS
jgi:hypothetical protein